MPARQTVVPERLLKRIAVLEGILVLLVLAFAFLMASFRATNSDLFMRLATGRLIAGGEFTFGKDPFTFTSEGVWVNHGWLFDVVAYLIYRTGEAGGVILVVVKALFVVLLAWLMLQTGSIRGQRHWLPALCTILAILAASPRFQLQPSVPSFVLMALMLYLLVRVGPSSRAIWFLPLVCMVWVNVDEWFLLGPVTIALFLLGEWIQSLRGGRVETNVAGSVQDGRNRNQASSAIKILGLVFLASLAACLVNPYHMRAFTLPPALDPRVLQSAAPEDDIFRSLFLSPLQQEYFHRNWYLSAAGLAWFPLVLLGILSFVAVFSTARKSAPEPNGTDRGLSDRGWEYWRVVIWLAYFVLSAWNVRAIPYFAVVAAPITSLNFLDFARRKLGPDALLDPGMRRWAISGRSFTILIFVLLTLVAVPGWLHSQPYYLRFVGWGINVDTGLKEAAEQVAVWHKEGRLRGDEHWFNTVPDTVHYFAWYGVDSRGRPLARGFIDQRLALFVGAMDEYRQARDALRGILQLRMPESRTPDAWRKVMAARNVSFLVFQAHFMDPILLHLYDNPDEWEPRFVEGRSAVFAWHLPRREMLLERHARRSIDEINFETLAFGPRAVRAPDEPARSAGARSWWQEFLFQDSSPSVAAGTARQHLLRFKALSRRYSIANFIEWQGMTASSLVGTAASPGGPFVNGALLPLRMSFTFSALRAQSGEKPTEMDKRSEMLLQIYIQSQDPGPVSSLYLAIRYARQAIRENPEDLSSYLLLAEAYQLLSERTREREVNSGRQLQLVDLVRRSQRAAALRSVLALNPRPEIGRRANLMLAELFNQPHFDQQNRPQPSLFFESMVACLREAQRLDKSIEPAPGVPEEVIRQNQDRLEQTVQGAEQELKKRLNSYEVISVGKPLLQKVLIAIEKGLSEKAVTLLTAATADDLKKDKNSGQFATISLTLLLSLGRLPEARLGLVPESDAEKPDKRALGTNPMGLPAYQSLLVVLFAASGDYEAADAALQDAIPDIEAQSQHAVRPTLAQMDVIDAPGPADSPQPLGTFVGLMVGDILLRNAPQAAGLPWQILPHAPIRTHKPEGWKAQTPQWSVRVLPPPNLVRAATMVGSGTAGLLSALATSGCAAASSASLEGGNESIKEIGIHEITLFQASQFLLQWRQSQADLWTIRAWLALEQGRIDRTAEYASKAIDLAEIERTKDGTRAMVAFRSLPLTQHCLRLIQPGRR